MYQLPFFLRIFAGAVLSCAAVSGFAQASLNVKVRPEAGYTRLWLASLANENAAYRMAPPEAFNGSLGFLAQVTPLSPQQNELSGIFTLTFSNGNAQVYTDSLLQSGLFEYVEPNLSRYIDKDPTADLYRRAEVDIKDEKAGRILQTSPVVVGPEAGQTTGRQQSGDDSLSNQWYHSYIGTFAAWGRTRGSNAIRIGVIDTGLDFGHEELQGQYFVRSGEDLNGNGTLEPWPADEVRQGVSGDFDGLDNDANGYADDVAGYDFVDQPRSPFGGDYLGQDPYPLDQNGHGTVVTGIMVAKADNGAGGAGIAPDCRVVVLRAFNSSGAGEDDDIARAIVYAADNGVSVLNFSFGDAYASRTMHEAIRYAWAKGVTMIASAGNGTGDNPHYPSDYSEVLSVAATDANGTNEYLWPLSSFGVSTDLAAPGSGIFAPVLRDTASDGTVTQYTTTQGTSTAAPMVSAAVGLLFADRGEVLPPRQVRGMLTTTCDDISSSGWDHYTGAGRLNIPALLAVQGAAIVQLSAPITDDVATADTLIVTGTVLDPAFATFSLEYQAGAEGGNTWIPLLQNQQQQVQFDTLLRWPIATLPAGTYTLRLRADRTDGKTTEDRVRFLVDRSAPEVAILLATTAWDNNERGLYVTYRDSDPGPHSLRFRRQGESEWHTMANDRKTKTGDFLISGISNGFYDLAVLANGGSSDTVQAVFSEKDISFTRYYSLGDSLPLGNFLPGTYDFDGDGYREVVMSQYDSTLGFGPMCIYEYRLDGFVRADSNTLKPILIPKGVADTDGDGLLEILCSVQDSTYLLEQKQPGAYPSEVIFTQFSPGYYAAGFADPDGDGAVELMMRQTPVVAGKSQPLIYDIWEGGGSTWNKAFSLPDPTPYKDIGGATSRILAGDFDGDGQQETLFGDYDGDIWVYEFRGESYELSWQDSSTMSHAGEHLVAGDLDGKPGLEFATFTYTRPGRLNDDNEYDPVYAELRIWQAVDNDSFSVLHREVLYDLDVEDLQAVTLGELDGDPGAELVISTYPRTYILSHSGGNFEMDWFLYGSLVTDHIIGDFDQNGKNELLLGTGDKAERFVFDDGYAGPAPVTRVEGWSLDAITIKLAWIPTHNAASYTLWRMRDYPNDSLIYAIAPGVTDTIFTDTNLDSGVQYLYLVQAVNPSLAPAESDLFQAGGVVLTPHQTNRVVSVTAINERQVQVVFAQPLAPAEQHTRQVRLDDGERSPSAVVVAAKTMMVSFDQAMEAGVHSLRLDTLLLDTQRGVLAAADTLQVFEVVPVSQKMLFLTHWQVVDSQAARLYFRWPVTEAALDPAQYKVSPGGKVVAVDWGDDAHLSVVVRLSDVQLGALGYAVSVIVQESVCSLDGVCLRAGEGNVATFTAYAQDLSSAVVFPNPVRLGSGFGDASHGVRFGGLLRECDVQVFTLSGAVVAELREEGDGDGGLFWDLVDRVSGQRVLPGLYLYRVRDADGAEFVGQFSVLE